MREGMWALVQQGISTLEGFDFAAYAEERLGSCRRASRRCRARTGGRRCVTALVRSSSAAASAARASPTTSPSSAGPTSCCVDRDQLTSGSTFHSAGLVGQLRSSVTLTRMMMYGTDLYRRLHAETGHDPGWREVGSLRLASSRAPPRGAAPPGGMGVDVRSAARVDLHRRGPRRCSTACSTRPACSARCTCRPTASSTRPTSRWRWPPAPGPAASRSPRTPGSPAIGVAERERSAPGHARRHRSPQRGSRDRVRGRRQRRRHVQPRDRTPRRCQRADRADGPPVRDHPAEGVGPVRPADDA